MGYAIKFGLQFNETIFNNNNTYRHLNVYFLNDFFKTLV